RIISGLKVFSGLAPASAISVAMTIATAAIYVRLGLGGALFVLISILAYTYMARLVVTARRRTRQYASLSWGVLSGLLRTIDGRGYPDGLKADEIPELAKIVAVAETYDTLTAEDTYRSPVSSFEALTELRRVAGTQLDAKYVEAVAELLAGRGVDYRHANRA